MSRSLSQPTLIYLVLWCKSRSFHVAKHKATATEQRQESRKWVGKQWCSKESWVLVVSGLLWECSANTAGQRAMVCLRIGLLGRGKDVRLPSPEVPAAPKALGNRLCHQGRGCQAKAALEALMPWALSGKGKGYWGHQQQVPVWRAQTSSRLFMLTDKGLMRCWDGN